MSDLPKSYDPKSTEESWYRFWEESGFFKPKASHIGTYAIVIPPPNVTGVLHMGHALVDTLQDILIRWKRMLGHETVWIPGTDHAGIATQAVVERHLLKTKGKRRTDFSKEDFLKEVWKWKELSQDTILNQIRKLGCSCDWSRLCFTMDEPRSRAVRYAFKKFFDEGLIYRGDYLVNWDPILQTALSDDEVEHEEVPSFLWHIRYPLKDSKETITIATTRPETLLGDTAVAVHPKDARYQHLIGKEILLPLTNRAIPIVADPFVDREFGSGAVKITPAHDWNDFELAKRHSLEHLNILTPDAKINECGGVFEGMSVEEARGAVVSALENLGLLEKKEPHMLRIGLSYRSKAVIQPYLSKQWFFKMSAFKSELLKTVLSSQVTLLPEHWIATYTHWIEGLRDWCISRQIWWGHPIPIWYHSSGKILCSDEEGTPEEVKNNPDEWVQDPDVLDTWFSSALWPLSTLGWPDNTPDLQKFYPTSTLITGHDILFFWVARMILVGTRLKEEVPFHQVFLHGLIYGKSYWRVDAQGQIAYVTAEEKKALDLGQKAGSDIHSRWEKMSKSKGNVLDPLEIIQDYGTDALRITLASSVTHARQIDLDRRKFEEFKNFANKLWNGARFVFMHLEGLTPTLFAEGLDMQSLKLEDRWILSRMDRLIQEVNAHLTEYAFDKAATKTYSFFWNDFCSIYLELSKPSLSVENTSQKIQKQKLLSILLLSMIRLLHPMTPFITEELFSHLKKKLFKQVEETSLNSKPTSIDPYTVEALEALASPACITAPYPQTDPKTSSDPEVEATFTSLLEVVRILRNLRMHMQLPPKQKTDLYILGHRATQSSKMVEQYQGILSSLVPVSRFIFEEKDPAILGSAEIFEEVKLFIPIPEMLQAKEEERQIKEKQKLELLLIKTKEQLANPEFLAKAPSHIVENLKKTLEETMKKLHDIVD